MSSAVGLLTIHFHGNFTHRHWSIITINLHERPMFILVDLLEELYISTLTKLRGLSPRANNTDRAAAAGRRS